MPKEIEIEEEEAKEDEAEEDEDEEEEGNETRSVKRIKHAGAIRKHSRDNNPGPTNKWSMFALHFDTQWRRLRVPSHLLGGFCHLFFLSSEVYY